MLYRCGILTPDSELDADIVCTLSGTKLSFEASKRTLTVEITENKKGYTLTVPMTADERIFGLGDDTRENVMVRGLKVDIYIANVASYGPMPVIMSSDGWGFVLNTTFRSTIDCGSENPDEIRIDVSEGRGVRSWLKTEASL